MPELPEVETIRLGVAQRLLGRTLSDFAVFSARAVRKEDNLADFDDFVGKPVAEVARRGKFLWIVFEGAPRALMVHLGMSGQLLYDSPPHKHTAATFSFDDGGTLAFVDQRTFGYVRTSQLIPTADGRPAGEGTQRTEIPAAAAHIARDPLDPHLDLAEAAARMSRTSSAMKRVLLDQRFVSGIGNIYADETAWAAQLNPTTASSLLGEEELQRVIATAGEVMAKAVAAGGTSFDALYVNVEGESGYFSRELTAYGRAGLPCARCGTLIVKTVLGGRATYVCPSCQTTGYRPQGSAK